jgi:soluble lytic murein transglycosylase-like protein
VTVRWIVCWFLLSGIGHAADPYANTRAAQEASIEKQKASIRIQQAAAAKQNPAFFVRTAMSAPFANFPCEEGPPAAIREIVDKGAQQSGLDRSLVRAVVKTESDYDPCATSNKGAQGLMQLMPSVQTQFGVTNPYDPKQNVDAGTRLLKQLLDQYGGDLPRALGAYNAGSARVDQFGGVPPFPETVNYVSGILEKLGVKPAAPPPALEVLPIP